VLPLQICSDIEPLLAARKKAYISPTRPRPLLLPSPRTGCRHLPTQPPSSPPFFRQFFLPGFFADRFRLGFTPRLSNRPFPFRRSRLANRFQRPRWRRASCRRVARKPLLLRKFLLLDSGGRLFRKLVCDRGLWLRFLSGSRFRMAFLCHGTRWTARSGEPAIHPARLRR
jgi:hypothetical protein